jgi:glucose-6-phosphate 1-dehydrogenase
MPESIPAQDIAVFGATGHLARTRLWPAIYALTLHGLLPERGRIVGLARSDLGQSAFEELVKQASIASAGERWDEGVWRRLSERLLFVPLVEEGYAELKRVLQEQERLVYLATPPSAFGPTVRELADNGLVKGTHLMIEKPFGHDLESALELDRQLSQVLDESQIYRIDHYLGKETVQNILVFRFGNSVFERVWNRDAIHHIDITVAESEGIEGRGAFYEGVGALRDVAENHLLQVLSLLTMEPPARFDGERVRDETAKLLEAVRPLNPRDVVRGQYTRGHVEGQEVLGYREEPEIPADSQTETFVAMKVEIDNWRWAGVPIFLRTGKRLPSRRTEIEIAFFDAPTSYFDTEGQRGMEPNRLVMRVQPEEEIEFTFLAKVPGPQVRVEPVSMKFNYASVFGAEQIGAYERLLRDAMAGDHTLFVRSDSVQRAWEIVQPVLDAPGPLSFYEAGTWGPRAAENLIAPLQWCLK